MTIIVSKAGIHCIGPKRTGYYSFLSRINAAGRRLSIVKCRDDFGAIMEPVTLWPDVLTIGAFTEFDRLPFDFRAFEKRASLNPQVKYWEVLNEDDTSSTYAAKADLYISIAPLFKARGWGLGLFSCSSGTPPYPSEDGGQSYREIARACKFMRNGGYDAILCLHEYVSDGGTVGRFATLADYLEQHDALLPIAITEYGYETHPGDDEFMRMVKAQDPIYMRDPRVIGCALWTLGGGGWGGSNYQSALPQLGEYIATVEDKDRSIDVSFVFGVHCTASPGPMLPGDAAGIVAAQKFSGYKFLTGDPPEHYQQVKSLGIDPANCLTRLFIDLSNHPKPTPEQFCESQSLAINEAMQSGVMWFEIHNEPNLGASYGDAAEWPYSDNPHDFIAWYLQVAALLRAQHPGIKLVSPGLSPQPNTPQWWSDFGAHGVFDASDAIGAHVYWPDRDTMLTREQGLNFFPLLPASSATKPIFITEFCNNIARDADHEKGLQYCDWAAYIQANFPTVTRAYLYIISSGTLSDNNTRQTIVRNGTVSAIATGIKDGSIDPAAIDYLSEAQIELEITQNHLNEARRMLMQARRATTSSRG